MATWTFLNCGTGICTMHWLLGGYRSSSLSWEISYQLGFDVVYSQHLCQFIVDSSCSAFLLGCDWIPEQLLRRKRQHSSWQFLMLKVKFLIFITELPLLFQILNRFGIFVYTFLSEFEENTLKNVMNSLLAQKWKTNNNTSYI